MTVELFIARRHLASQRKRGFVSVISTISAGGVALGVAALVIVLSLMNGFASEVRDKLVGMDAHLRLLTFHNGGVEDFAVKAAEIRTMPDVIGVTPFVMSETVVTTGKYTAGARIKGVEAATILEVSDLERTMTYGALDLERQADGVRGIVLGRGLADRLRLVSGEPVYLVSPQGTDGQFPLAPVMPKLGKFVVTGIFETGMHQFDSALALVSVSAAQSLFGLNDRVTGIEVKMRDMFDAPALSKALERRFHYPHYAIDWMEANKHLFSWMTLEKWGMFIVLSLIVLVGAFNIASTLIMVVLEKTREIGILKAMGATAGNITRIFAYQGLLVGAVGTLVGLAVGYVLCWMQETFAFISLPADIYIISALPVEMRPGDFAGVAVAALAICLLTSLYPARKAAALLPVEAIRYA